MSQITDFEELDTLEGDEVFYAVKDGKDYHVSFEKIKELATEDTKVIVLGDFKW